MSSTLPDEDIKSSQLEIEDEASGHNRQAMMRIGKGKRCCWISMGCMLAAVLALLAGQLWAGLALTLASALALGMARFGRSFITRARGVLSVRTLSTVQNLYQTTTLFFVIGMMIELLVLVFRIINRL